MCGSCLTGESGARVCNVASEWYCICTSAKSNMRSAVKNQKVVEVYLTNEVQLSRVIGPPDPTKFPHIHINRFGVIPKNHQPGKWRLIVDLSYPEGNSVNDGIPP